MQMISMMWTNPKKIFLSVYIATMMVAGSMLVWFVLGGPGLGYSFQPNAWFQSHRQVLQLASSPTENDTSAPTDSSVSGDDLESLKANLVRICMRKPKPALQEVRMTVNELEDLAERRGVGQSSALSGLLSGEWELIYASEDDTRSSPFFWAFRKAFPEQSDQIFGITDAIPAPIKEVGPAFQEIDFNTATQTGRFVSRVKVATLAGAATSIMTTRASITGIDGVDGLRLQIETTKPEQSTVVSTLLGPLGDVINENSPPFPSGEALERVRPGSSTVILRTTYCDEGLRISRNDDRSEELYVWRRKSFVSYDAI